MKINIPIEVLTLLSPDGFEKKFHFYCSETKTYAEAYEKTEQEYEAAFGKRKYSGYDSFRVVKNKRLKKRN
tara:strand:+ start:3251 stop:3463 length:213 start_codon:yes stop_codon:yes gene_type:complete